MRFLFAALIASIFPCLFGQESEPVYVFSTLAGEPGVTGSADGTGNKARFHSPTGIAVDGAGNVYVCDSDNGTIRKISAAGVVTTLAGRAGVFGAIDGFGSEARFGRFVFSPVSGLPTPLTTLLRFPSHQMGIAVDRAGSVYVADTANSAIRRISPSGQVTTIAGSLGSVGYLDETGELARFALPVGIAVDADGQISVAESGNRTVRQISPEDVVTTLVGAPEFRTVSVPGTSGIQVPVDPVDGTRTTARFFGPTSIAYGRDGDIYVTDYSSVRKVTRQGVVSTIAGSLDPILPFNAVPASRISLPSGIAVDADGAIFFCDAALHSVGRVSAAGAIIAIAGSSSGNADGVGTQATFRSPKGIAIDADGNLYVSDTTNQTIRKGLRVMAPKIQTQPVSQVIVVGQSITLTVAASARVPMTYQWRRNGSPIPGATNAALTLVNPTEGDAGSYSVAVTNLAGTTASAAAALTLPAVVLTPPTITAQPQAQAVLGGQSVTLTTVAAGSGSLTYQWQRDGTNLPGATNATLVVAAAQAGDAGGYTVEVRGAGGVVRSAIARVEVNTSRIVNLSIRSAVTPSAPVLTVGFVVSGGSKSLLIRGTGPGLGQFGLSGVLADPRLALFAAANVVANNDNWSSAANASDVAAGAARLGAFALPAGSLDAALLTDVGAAAFSAQITGGANASGIVLVELYDANAAAAARLVNVSARSFVGTGDGLLVAGFVVEGNSPGTLLIRAIGPTLAAFGVGGVLVDPKIEIFASGSATPIAANDNWGVAPSLAATFTALGAFPLAAADSKDAAVLITLSPGSYTAQVSGVGNATGEALVEIYEAP